MASLRVLECEYFTAERVAELKSSSEPTKTIPVPRPHVFLFELCAVIVSFCVLNPFFFISLPIRTFRDLHNQVKGELPVTQLRSALESAQLPVPPTPEWSCASIIADTIAHLAQEVCPSSPLPFAPRFPQSSPLSAFTWRDDTGVGVCRATSASRGTGT